MTDIFAIREEGKLTLIELLAELDRLSILAIKKKLAGLVKGRRKNFIINFSKIDSVSSTIVGALMGMRNLVSEHGGDLVLCFVKPKSRCTFDLIGVSKMLKIYNSEADAIASF
jgi:anti-anti-sigma factor